jgi:hypothetical protein
MQKPLGQSNPIILYISLARPSYHNISGRLFRAASRVARSINGPLHMSRDTILARVELASDDAVLAEWAADLLADLTDVAVGVDWRWYQYVIREVMGSERWKTGLDIDGDDGYVHCFPIAPAEEMTLGFSEGIALVPLFAPILSAAAVVLSLIFEVDCAFERPS